MTSNHLSKLSPLMACENETGMLSILSHFLTVIDKPHNYLK